eukprot:scaffold4688_cov125-Isochrysis_galbana.AAC.1
MPHVWAQKGELSTHGRVQCDPQAIHAHQLTQGTRGPLHIPPHPRRPQASSHPHPICHPEGAPQAIVNFMIILWKNILISFYKVDLENQPFDPNL